jgi:hypothetical protein
MVGVSCCVEVSILPNDLKKVDRSGQDDCERRESRLLSMPCSQSCGFSVTCFKPGLRMAMKGDGNEGQLGESFSRMVQVVERRHELDYVSRRPDHFLRRRDTSCTVHSGVNRGVKEARLTIRVYGVSPTVKSKSTRGPTGPYHSLHSNQRPALWH